MSHHHEPPPIPPQSEQPHAYVPPGGLPYPYQSHTIRQKINGDMWKLIFQVSAIALAASAIIYTNKSDIAVLKTKIDSIQTDVAKVETSMESVKPDLLRSEVNTAQRDAGIALNQASSHGLKLDDINTQLTALYAQMAEIQKDIHEYTRDRFTGAQGDELERRIDSLEKE